MELRHMRYFVALAEELHFTRAAARLHIAQPSLSHQIQLLEQDLGARLLARSKRRVELTEAGRAFLVQARRVLEEADEARRVTQSADRGEAGRLAIGFAGVTAYEVMPRALHAYRTRYPRIELILRELNLTAQVEDLAEGRLDIALMHTVRSDPRVRSEVLRHERLSVALPAGHALAHRRRLRLRDLADEPFVLGPHASSRSGLVHTLIAICERAGFVPHVAQEVAGPVAQLGLVAAGVGVGLLPETVERIRTPHVVLRHLEDRDAMLELAVAWRADDASPAVSAFVRIARTATRRE